MASGETSEMIIMGLSSLGSIVVSAFVAIFVAGKYIGNLEGKCVMRDELEADYEPKHIAEVHRLHSDERLQIVENRLERHEDKIDRRLQRIEDKIDNIRTHGSAPA